MNYRKSTKIPTTALVMSLQIGYMVKAKAGDSQMKHCTNKRQELRFVTEKHSGQAKDVIERAHGRSIGNCCYSEIMATALPEIGQDYELTHVCYKLKDTFEKTSFGLKVPLKEVGAGKPKVFSHFPGAYFMCELTERSGTERLEVAIALSTEYVRAELWAAKVSVSYSPLTKQDREMHREVQLASEKMAEGE